MRLDQIVSLSFVALTCSGASITVVFNQFFEINQISESVEKNEYDQTENSIWIENEELITLHKNLIEIPSVSYDEAEVGDFLAERFEGKGITVESYYIDEKAGRRNLLVYLGKKKETRILLTSHIDTVPPFFPYSVDGNKIYGRGSVDDKASVASQIIAFEQLAESGEISEGDVALLLDVGEEKGGEGAKDAYENLKIPWEAVIFGEPTNLTLITGHKGGAAGVLKATGKTGHSSIPSLGINAIDLLIDALSDLRKASYPGSELLGESTLNIGLIEGGVAANVIPGEAKATLLLRVATENLTAIDDAFATALSNHPRVAWESYSRFPPVFFDYDIPGYPTSVFTGGTDASSLKGDFKKYLLGPGSFESIHAANEHLTVEELAAAVTVYKDVILYKLKN